MHIQVNDEPYTMIGPPDQTLGELANEVCQATSGSGARFVVGLRCDGRPVTQEELESVLQTSAARYDRLELETVPVAALVESTLDQALEILADSTHVREKAADLLAAGQQELALRELQRFLEAWKQIHQTLALVARVLGVDLDTVRAGSASLTDILEAVKTRFTDLRGAMIASDLVVVGDTLRYELSEPMQQLADVLRHLRDHAASRNA